jgi:hypothetical protein
MSETNKNRAGQRNTATSRSSTARKANADHIAAVKSARNTGSGQTARRSAGTNRRRKRRRQRPDFAKILLILIGIVIAVLCVAVGLKGCAKDSDEKTKYFLERRKESEQQTERKCLLHGRTGQTDIQSPGKQDERLYGDAGAKAGRTFEERRNYAKEIVSQKGYFDIVDEDGHVKFIDEKFLNDEMRNIESLCYKFGRKDKRIWT